MPASAYKISGKCPAEYVQATTKITGGGKYVMFLIIDCPVMSYRVFGIGKS